MGIKKDGAKGRRNLQVVKTKKKSELVMASYQSKRPISFVMTEDFMHGFLDEIKNEKGQVSLSNSRGAFKHEDLTSIFATKFAEDDKFIAVVAKSGSSSVFLDSRFTNLSGSKSSAIALDNSELTLQTTHSISGFSDNYAETGSTISAVASTLSVSNMEMKDNYSLTGGCFNLHGSKTNVDNVIFEGNSADEGGVFYATNGNTLRVENSKVLKQTSRDSAFLYSMNNLKSEDGSAAIQILNSSVHGNEADMNLVHALLSDMEIN